MILMSSSQYRGNARVNGQRLFAWVVFLLFSIPVVLNILKDMAGLKRLSYQSWEISDWLVNYQGGFVRRGLMGELLWLAEQVHPFDVRMAIAAICVLSSLVVLGILLRIFRKQGWAVLVLPTGLFLGFTFFNLWARRDMLSLAMTYWIFLAFRRALDRHVGVGAWLGFHALSVLQLLIHEASFFYTFPILMVYSYNVSSARGKTVAGSIADVVTRFLPALCVMALVCIFKGDEGVAGAVWASWSGVFDAFPAGPSAATVGEGVKALGWNAWETFYNHLYTSYLGCYHPTWWGVPMSLFNLMVAYFLLTRLDAVDMGLYPRRETDHTLLSNVALVQFVTIMPLFTVLSCDWGRTLPYLVISTVFFYHLFRQGEATVAPRLAPASSALQEWITRSRVLSSPYTYILLVLLTPFPRYHIPFDSMNTFQQRFVEAAASFIHLFS